MGSQDKRRFVRLDANFIAKIRAHKASPETLRMIAERVDNISKGGVFITTNTPFSMGSVVELDFQLPGQEGMVHAKGIVRWSGTAVDQTGMGIEFLEVTIPNREAIHSYIDGRVATQAIRAIVETPVQRDLLKLHHRRLGETFKIDVLLAYLSAPESQVRKALQGLEQVECVKIDGKDIMFVTPPDENLSAKIDEWVRENSDSGPGAEGKKK